MEDQEKGKDLTPPGEENTSGSGVANPSTEKRPPTPPVEPPKPKSEGGATVEVKRSVLETLLGKVERMEKENLNKDKRFAEIIKDNEMLKATADKARVQRYESQHADYTHKVARVSIFEGKIVTGWKMEYDNVGKNPNTKLWSEKQTVIISYRGADEEANKEQEQKMDYTEFDKLEKIDCKFIKDSVTTDEDGVHRMITLDVQGKEMDIDVRFLNQ